MSKGTTMRTVRVAGPLWSAALAVAEKRGETLSDVMRDRLTTYVIENGGEVPDAESVAEQTTR